MTRNRLYLLLVLLGIITIVMMWDSSNNVITPPEAEQKPDFPYAVAEQASTRYFNEDGGLEYAFTASRLEHFRLSQKKNDPPQEEYTLIKQPHFIVFEQETPWHIESLEGKLVRTREQITLWNSVRIWQETDPADADAQGAPLMSVQSSELSTEKLVINPIEKVAHTAEPVRIRTPYGEIDAVGMTADFKSRNIQLHNRVRAIHKVQEHRKIN